MKYFGFVGTDVGASLFACAVFLLLASGLEAADHIDFHGDLLGSEVEPAADISDVFAWIPTAGRLALVMNVHPGASEKSHFSSSVDYQFRLRRVTLTKDREVVQVPSAVSADEVTIVCRVNDDRVTCSAPAATASAPVGKVVGDANSALRVFAGLRADPFHLDVEGATSTILSGFQGKPTLTMPRADRRNFSDSLNVLSLVVDLDVAAILGPGDPLIAVVGETARR